MNWDMGTQYLLQEDGTGKVFSLRKRVPGHFEKGTGAPYWRFYDSLTGEWVGGINLKTINQGIMDRLHPVSEEDALLIILTKQWKGMKLIP